MNIQNKKMELITYDCGNRFLLSKFKHIRNIAQHVKPEGGLWASPVNSKFGWKDWCKQEDFSDLATAFAFSFTGSFLVIDSVNDLKKIPKVKRNNSDYYTYITFFDMNFEKIKELNIDAIHLTVKGELVTRFSKPSLYGWDCESILILNPNNIAAKD